MRVVFDSNIYISALAIPGGVAEAALRAAIDGSFEIALSRPILGEVLEVLSRKFSRDPEELARTALFLSSLGETVNPSRKVHVLDDEADNRILECALAARADLIVTGDRQMLLLASWEGIDIVSLRQFVDRLRQKSQAREPAAPYRSGRRGNVLATR